MFLRGRSRLVIAFTVLALILMPLITLLPTLTVNAAPPTSVTLAGDLQSELGCPGDWQPDCAITHMGYDTDDDVWQFSGSLPAGGFNYKVALNDGWGQNYGRYAQFNGPNIPLNLAGAAAVKFYYDDKTHWIADNLTYRIVTAPGDFQSELGCPGDWQPDCLRSWMVDPDEDGTFEFITAELPAGNYEVKAAINESWGENYGAGCSAGGANIPFTVGTNGDPVRFRFVSGTNCLTVDSPFIPSRTVTAVGDFQSEAGCPGDWQPDCATTHLGYDTTDLIYQAAFNLPAGAYEFKAAINDSWAENYGINASFNGGNIPFSLGALSNVKFYYSDVTHWITNNVADRIVSAPGDYQSEIGCPGDWQPDCLRSWLQDPDGDDIYIFQTRLIPPGTYQTKAAINEGWAENYGDACAFNGGNITFDVPAPLTTVTFTFDSASNCLTISTVGAPVGDIRRQRAYWLEEDLIAWGGAGAGDTVQLHYDYNAGLGLDPTGVTGGSAITLTYDPAGVPANVAAKFPHLAGLRTWRISSADLPLVPTILKGQFAVSALNASSVPVDATGLQIPGVLDDLFTYTGDLGLTFNSPPTIRVWAPTAQDVNLLLFADANPLTPPTSYDMTYDPATGVWSIVGLEAWNWQYYLFEVTVYAPTTRQIEVNRVTDPYSINLSMNATRSQIVNLDDPATKPAGWDSLAKPPLAAPEDTVIYELHVRDFSIFDTTVPAAWRGTFKAFTVSNSDGVNHLRALANAGLTSIHLLPAFDIASVNEDKTTHTVPNYATLASYAPDSQQQQADIEPLRNSDGFNWGYDPVHYGVPDGSYATDPNGLARVIEFREMVQALNQIGLRVIMDVVYNHTSSSGQNTNSVLDRIVPGYYHRLNNQGDVERSSCCENTASEHNMMEKLMLDTLRTWTVQYKVDGYRFDLMGHHMKRNMEALRTLLNSLTPANSGIDGRSVYVYGEAWNFGEVANNARGENAIQRNMNGTGIGSFNDRLRDGNRGGGPFDDPRYQGFATGLHYDPNGVSPSTLDELLRRTDWVKIGIAGTLRDYTFVDRFGNTVAAINVDYQGQNAGYTSDPQEVINYVDAHDNDTLFDGVQFKAPAGTSMADRVRMNHVTLSVVMLSQGIPFFHAGTDLLRSKSMDRNSYNSGDWFNRLDWTYQTNNWGVGLPPAGDNSGQWGIMQPLLADASLRPAPSDIDAARRFFLEMLQVRRSSGLFRLQTAAQVQERLTFYNDGPTQVPGVIVYTLADTASLSAANEILLVVINAADTALTYSEAAFVNLPLELHPILAASFDPATQASTFARTTGTANVAPRTVAVFVYGLGRGGGGSTAAGTGGTPPSVLPSTGYPPAPESPFQTALPFVVGAVLAGLALGVSLITRRQ